MVFPEGTLASAVKVVFEKYDPDDPVSADISLHACFHPATPSPTTTAPPTSKYYVQSFEYLLMTI